MCNFFFYEFEKIYQLLKQSFQITQTPLVLEIQQKKQATPCSKQGVACFKTHLNETQVPKKQGVQGNFQFFKLTAKLCYIALFC